MQAASEMIHCQKMGKFSSLKRTAAGRLSSALNLKNECISF